jgi:hypothetical protein
MSLLDSLPGLEMPVSEVPGALKDLWSQTEHGENQAQPGENYRAVQSNLILHLGLKTSDQEAREVLEQALKFAERYPCRIICLCPFESSGEQLLRGKLFSQCSLSGGGGHPVCSEALMLGYSLDDSEFLEHQVSIWLESDLPTYHWFHRLPADRIQECYMPFLKMVTRVTYDSSLEGTGDMCKINWPCPRGARDLAETRLLHVRQGLGQLLSGFPIETLVVQLSEIKILYGSEMSGEARGLAKWLQDCLRCAEKEEEVSIVREQSEAMSGLDCRWTYSGMGKSIHMKFSKDLCQGEVEINLGRGARIYPLRLKKPTKELTLAEALFF